jgi:SAM-dependent methyltransferase
VPDLSDPTRLARLSVAYGLGKVAGAASVGARKLSAERGPSLEGDRVLEWSYCVARLADGPGTTLDFGADVGFLSLAAAQRGHDVVALDRLEAQPNFAHERVKFVQGDILERPLEGRTFDQILNCSSVEHVGLAGRYGSGDSPDGDLEAMAILRDRLAPGGRMIMTIPVGRDLVCPPLHRIYGEERLPRLIDGYDIAEEQYWCKDEPTNRWLQRDRDTALATQGSPSFYAIGLFQLTRP